MLCSGIKLQRLDLLQDVVLKIQSHFEFVFHSSGEEDVDVIWIVAF